MYSYLYLLVPITTWVVSHLIKFAYRGFKENKIEFKTFIESGGVVSAHSAVVTALSLTIGLLEGVRSAAFGISLVVAIVVIYDSFVTRRLVGETLNYLHIYREELIAKTKIKKANLPRIHLGHNPSEVIRGVLLGIIVALSFNYQTWNSGAVFLVESVGSPLYSIESKVYLLLFSTLLLLGLALNTFWTNKIPKRFNYKKVIARYIYWGITLPSLFSILLLWLAHENAQVITWRIWFLVLTGVIVVVSTIFTDKYHKKYKFELAKFKIDEKKQKKKSRKSKKKSKKKRK